MRAVDFEADVDPYPNASKSPRSGVPEFRAPGLLGNSRLLRHDPVDLLTAAHAACGDVVVIPIAPKVRIYTFRHPDAVREIVMDRSGAIVRGRTYAWLRRDMGVALLGSDGHDHDWRRVALQPAFTPSSVAGYGPVMERSVATTVARWSEVVDTVVNVQIELSELVLRVIGEVMFGGDFTTAAQDMQGLFAEGTNALGELIGTVSQGLPRWIPTRINRRVSRVRTDLEKELRPVIERRMASRADSKPDLIDQMTCPASGGSNHGQRRYETSREILDEAKGIIGAGHETTANLLVWAIYFLAIHPEIDGKLHDEVVAVTPDRPVTVADLPALPYCARVIHETLRLMSPAWAILRDAVADTSVAGVSIPKGAFVVCSPYVTQRDPRWYPEPLRFLPERDELYPEPPKFAYFPFGMGEKHCIGRSLAEIESQLILAELVRHFRFIHEGGRFAEPITRVAVKPKNGMPLRVRHRSEA